MTGHTPDAVFLSERAPWRPLEGFQIGARTVIVDGRPVPLAFRDRARRFRAGDLVEPRTGCLLVNGKPSDHGERIKEGLERAKAEGKQLGRPIHGHMTEDLPALRAAGRTWAEIADKWNARGLRTARGNRWTPNGIRLISKAKKGDVL